MTNELIPAPTDLTSIQYMAQTAVLSKMYKNIGDESGIMMIMLTARELGLPAMQALNGGINIIQGKVELSARLMNALMRRAGISINVKESSDERCILIGKRSDNGDEVCAEYTIDDAKRAGLVKVGGGWTKFPKDMCFARAISRLARQIAPDVIGGCYVEGEIREAMIVEPVEQFEPKLPSFNISEPISSREILFDEFEESEHASLEEYIIVVKDHFRLSEDVVIEKFLQDKNLKEKFTKWKSKRVKDAS